MFFVSYLGNKNITSCINKLRKQVIANDTSFPEYLGPKDTVSIWGNSYGGYWTTGTFAYFQDQNAKIANGTLDRDKYKTIHLDTLGITNGCIDLEATADSYVTLPFNNTYGVQLYNETVYNFAKEQLYMPGGCMDQLHQCRAIRDEGDPGDSGNNNTVNSICTNATSFCSSNVLGPFIATGVRASLTKLISLGTDQ